MMFENEKGITTIETHKSRLAFEEPFRLAGCHFTKVSFDQFKFDCRKLESAGALWFESESRIHEYYDAIQLPRRATKDSAGYDFYAPFPCSLVKDIPVTIPTGVRIILNPGTFLMCVPRSGLGFEYGMKLRNGTGIIDAGYAWADNEGHIMAKITTEESFKLNTGDRFMQGIILPFFVTEDDNADGTRTGGFGSTGGAAL